MEKRFNIDWDDGLDKLTDLILNDESLPEIHSLIIGNWGDPFESESSQYIIDMLVEHASRFSHLESLFIGDMESEDCEISWIQQGDYSRLYAALPGLKTLIIKGAQDLQLGDIHHEKLEHLEIISGGLHSNVLSELKNARLPALKTLKLYLGIEDYGFDGSLDDVMALASKDLFPALTHLGLMNSGEQDEIARRVLQSDILPQLKVLELSCGTLTDKGGEALLEHKERLQHLEKLDLHYHYLTPEMQKKLLAALSIDIDMSDACHGDRYIHAMITE
ncbi:cytoplasmic protein [Superficieibacter electus]|uniref:Cytoplasmic protein n=1 Tax=Superficieibacter electus TaxID=2022662 RepID=A0A2P5GLR7_9ENTR|nr:STM4015 family protein [Superficieibacter electus]POP43772.1 cytoplasmic protein [Superficieibacter electus]POP46175.1 cytoplasmic protein [Superficieibacter electus]